MMLVAAVGSAVGELWPLFESPVILSPLIIIYKWYEAGSMTFA